MKSIVDLLASRRFATYLLIATLLIILSSNLLPNLSIMRPDEIDTLRRSRPFLYTVAKSFRVGKIVKTPFFLALPVFIFISITACTVRRTVRELRRGRISKGDARHHLDFSGEIDAVEEFLKGKGWRIAPAEGGKGISAHKGRNGFWGSVLFHIGMNVVLLGILLSLVTRFNGAMTLTEGYGVDISEGFMEKVPDGFPVKRALLEGFKAVYAGEFPVDYGVELILSTDFEDKKVRAGVNDPVSIGGYQISPSRYGFAPRFVLKKGRETVFDGYVNLVVFTPEQIDHFDVTQEKITVVTQFFPDFYKEGIIPKSHSKELKNPVFFIEVKRGKDNLGRGFLPVKKEVSFSGYSLECKDVKIWVMFDVARDLGVPAVTLGFVLIVTGLVIRFVLYEKFIWITVKDTGLDVYGRAGYFPVLFEDELKRVVEGLKQIK